MHTLITQALAPFVPIAYAEGTTWEKCAPEGVAQLSCATVVFQSLVFWALVFAGIVALFFIIFAGIRFIISGGDPKQVEGARKTLTYAIIGLVIILLSFFIVSLIGRLTGTCLSKFGFTITNFSSCN